MSCTEFLRRHRKVAGLGADAVAEIAAFIFRVGIDRQFDLVESETCIVGVGFVPHVVEHKELGLGAEIDGVADPKGLDHRGRLFGDAARVARIGLAGGRLQHVTNQHQRRFGEEGVDTG